MEEYYKYSDQLLANLFQNISKFLDCQQITSKFTTDLLSRAVFPPPEGGVPWALGFPGIALPIPGIAPSLWVPWEPWGTRPMKTGRHGHGYLLRSAAPRPMAPPAGGGIHSREARGG